MSQEAEPQETELQETESQETESQADPQGAATAKFDKHYASFVEQFHKICKESNARAAILLIHDPEIGDDKVVWAGQGHWYDQAVLLAEAMRQKKTRISNEINC